jgi:outer membrane murein-binding lipoprotein Lpp
MTEGLVPMRAPAIMTGVLMLAGCWSLARGSRATSRLRTPRAAALTEVRA